MQQYFLLYEELSHAMNKGDIGRVETCIVQWILILKAVGKHKYATHMTNFLIHVHFVYPAQLRYCVEIPKWCQMRLTLMYYRRTVRYHWLVNPSGTPMKWRAVDWCVELNNLFTKASKTNHIPYLCLLTREYIGEEWRERTESDS